MILNTFSRGKQVFKLFVSSDFKVKLISNFICGCRSPGKIINIAIPTFEALTQFGVAAVTTKNTGEVEASYSLTVLFKTDAYMLV